MWKIVVVGTQIIITRQNNYKLNMWDSEANAVHSGRDWGGFNSLNLLQSGDVLHSTTQVYKKAAWTFQLTLHLQ